MSRSIYEPTIWTDTAKNRHGVRNLKQKPSAMRWWTIDCTVGVHGCTGEEPTFINGFAQPGGHLELFAFRLNADGLIQTKGFVDVSTATSGTVAWVMPGANPGETDFIPPTSKNDAFSLKVTTTGDATGIINATGYIDKTTGEVTLIWRTQGVAIFEIKVFEDDHDVVAGDGKFKFDIPSDLDDASLIDVEAWVTGVGSGDTVVSFYNNTQGHDMLSTPVTIGSGELNDKDSGAPFVINIANADVNYGDEIWVNVDNAGAGALGLGVKVAFTPAVTAAITLQGAKGDPGGMTSFHGAWQNATAYQAGDIVTHNGILYIALQDHTSNAANDEPGVGTNWEDFWAPLIDVPLTAGLNVSVSSSVNGIADGIKATAVVPFDATISEWWMLADIYTDAQVDIWKTDFAGYPPSVANSIVAAAPPTLSTAIKNQSSTLTGWTTTVNEGDILSFYFSGVTLAARLTIFLGLEKT